MQVPPATFEPHIAPTRSNFELKHLQIDHILRNVVGQQLAVEVAALDVARDADALVRTGVARNVGVERRWWHLSVGLGQRLVRRRCLREIAAGRCPAGSEAAGHEQQPNQCPRNHNRRRRHLNSPVQMHRQAIIPVSEGVIHLRTAAKSSHDAPSWRRWTRTGPSRAGTQTLGGKFDANTVKNTRMLRSRCCSLAKHLKMSDCSAVGGLLVQGIGHYGFVNEFDRHWPIWSGRRRSLEERA